MITTFFGLLVIVKCVLKLPEEIISFPDVRIDGINCAIALINIYLFKKHPEISGVYF